MYSSRIGVLNIFIISLVLIYFTGCANRTVGVDSSKKSFDGEDRMILEALDTLESKDYNSSRIIFEELYDKTKKPEYKKESIALLIKLGDVDSAIEQSKEYLQNHENIQIGRLMIGAMIQKGDFENALKEMHKILKTNRSEENLELIASIYFGLEDYGMSIKYLESAYGVNNSKRILDRLVNTIYLFSDRKNDAISYLESHIRIYGCDRMLCEKLTRIYNEEKRYDQLLETYKKLYRVHKDEIYAKNIVEIYLSLYKIDDAIEFLKNESINDRMLLDIYRVTEDFENSKKIAKQLYKETNDKNYLAQEAIYEYELASAKGAIDDTILSLVVNKLERALEGIENDVYQNFLGYILIDHDIDYKKGLKFVREALKINPQSAYYLDSLAWGYYKLRMCQKAKETMQLVVDKIGFEEEEVREHWELIKECK